MKIVTSHRTAILQHQIPALSCFASLVAVFLLSVSSLTHAVDSVPLQQFSAKYTVENDYVTGGKATLSLIQNQQGTFDFVLRTKPTGIFKITGKGNITEHAILPSLTPPFESSHYSYADKGNPDRNYQIEFNRNDASFNLKKGELSEALPMPQGTLDRLSVTLAVLAQARTDEKFTSVTLNAMDGRNTQEITFINHGPEQIETGLGNITALRIRKDRKSSNRETVFWFAQVEENGPTIPVRIEQFKRDKLTMRLLITGFSRIE